MRIRRNTWHMVGSRRRVHVIKHKKINDIGWTTLCKQHVNGIVEEEIGPKKYPELTCQTCLRLSKK